METLYYAPVEGSIEAEEHYNGLAAVIQSIPTCY